MKQKIFFICKGIYDQQKLISADLYKLDQKVRDLKRETTSLLLRKNPGMTMDEVDQIFERYENRQVGKTLEAANDKFQSIQLAEQLGKKIQLGIKEREVTKKAAPEESKQKMSIVQELYQTPSTMLTKRRNMSSLSIFEGG